MGHSRNTSFKAKNRPGKSLSSPVIITCEECSQPLKKARESVLTHGQWLCDRCMANFVASGSSVEEGETD